MRDEIFCVMLLMYGHVLHENRSPLVLFSISNRLPHVGQNSNMLDPLGVWENRLFIFIEPITLLLKTRYFHNLYYLRNRYI